ncbi:MAG: DEAD/DEAH box helicase [Caulobacteraceae bacterium]|nr:DEAD/DEAH box helicase [Caulobacteraceae bacterium]
MLSDALTDSKLALLLGDRPLNAGRDYFEEGRVRLLGDRKAGGLWILEAEVQGTQRQPYRQAIRLRDDEYPTWSTIQGNCSCPVGRNCKHVVAAILAWREKNSDPDRIPADFEPWLGRVAKIVERSSEDYPPSVRQRLFYVLDIGADGLAVVRPLSVRLDKADRPTGPVKMVDSFSAQSSTPPKYLRGSDLHILAGLARRYNGGGGDKDDYQLADRAGGQTACAMVATGRCLWRSLEGQVVRLGPSHPAKGEWRVSATGHQHFGFTVEGLPGVQVLGTVPPCYFDPKSLTLGPLETGLSMALIGALMSAPAIPAGAAQDAAERMTEVLGRLKLKLPTPRVTEALETLTPTPVPIVRVGMESVDCRVEVTAGRRTASALRTLRLPVARLSFDYAGLSIDGRDKTRVVRGAVGGHAVRIARDLSLEARAADRLERLGLVRIELWGDAYPTQEQRGLYGLGADSEAVDFAPFILSAKTQLEREGWTVEVDPDFPLAVARIEPEDWTFDLEAADADGSGLDWFDLTLGVRIDGQRVDILPILAQLMHALPEGGEVETLRDLATKGDGAGDLVAVLGDGRVAQIPIARAAPILEGLISVWGVEQLTLGAPRVSRFQATELAELRERLGEGVTWTPGDRLLALGEALKGWANRAPTVTPPDFHASLRPYQQEGLDWLQMLARTGFGGILADDMGLGKTVQTLAHLAVEKSAGRLDGPVLVVAPTSVMPNWAAEAARFTPALKILTLRGPERAADFPKIAQSDLVITSYPLLARDRETLLAQDYAVVVLDEAQTIRNPVTAVAQAAHGLKAGQRIALSGTPVENHLGDVWSLMHFLNPGLLGNLKAFNREVRAPIEKHGDAAAAAHLAARLRPFLLRRTKDQVAGDLPAKTEIAETVEFAPDQADLYEATRAIMHERVREALAKNGLARSSVVVLDALLKLRQVCCDPRLVKTASAKGKPASSAKLARLFELVDQLLEEGRRVLIFSQFTSMLALIRERLEADGRDHAWLTGDTADRAEPVRRFQSGEVSLFLISLKAGGVGLNLTAADTVILYDPWWNPAVEAQAIDRAHRIGQTRPVFVHRLIAVGTIEEKMLALQSRKRDLAEALWSEEGAGMGALTEADVEALFG